MSSEPKPGRRAGPCIGKPSLQRQTEGTSCVFERPGCEIRILQVDGDKPVLLLDLRHDGFYHQHLELPFVEGKLKRRRSRMGLRPPSPFGWRTLVRCPTAVIPLSLLSLEGRKGTAVEQKPWRRCLLTSVEPRRGGGDIPQTEMCSRTESWAAAPSATKESPWRPCPGWWSVKCWTDRWPARGPNDSIWVSDLVTRWAFPMRKAKLRSVELPMKENMSGRGRNRLYFHEHLP